MFLFKHSSPLRCSRCVCSGTHKVVSNTSCFFLFVLYQRGRVASRDNIQYYSIKFLVFIFWAGLISFFFLIKKTSLNLFTQRFQISNFNFQCKREKYSQSLHKKKAWNSYHVLNFLRTLVKWDQAWTYGGCRVAEERVTYTSLSVCKTSKQQKKVPCYN